MKPSHIFEFTWDQLRFNLDDGNISTFEMADIFNRCGIPTQPSSVVTVKTWNEEDQQYNINDRNTGVIGDLKSQGMSAGKLTFDSQPDNSKHTWKDLGIESGATLSLVPMTHQDVKDQIRSTIDELRLDQGELLIEAILDGMKFTHKEDDGDPEFTLDVSKEEITSIPDVFGWLNVRSIKCTGKCHRD